MKDKPAKWIKPDFDFDQVAQNYGGLDAPAIGEKVVGAYYYQLVKVGNPKEVYELFLDEAIPVGSDTEHQLSVVRSWINS